MVDITPSNFLSGKSVEARDLYEETLKIAPYSLHMRAEAALCHVKTGSLERAEKLLDGIEKEYPDYPALSVYRGVLCEARNDIDGAVIHFRRALRLCPTDENLKDRIKRLRS